jgi:hypothetical protein
MQCPAPTGPGSGFMLRYTGDNVKCGVLLGQHLEQKGIQTKKSWPVHQSVQFFEVEMRGVRKVTTGITGFWQPSVHSNVTFLFFNAGSSYQSHQLLDCSPKNKEREPDRV